MSKYRPYKKSKSKKSNIEKSLHYPEPHRKSLFDVVSGNMKFVGRYCYVHRIIYIGDHMFPSGTPDDDIDVHFKRVITSVNSQYCEEYLTGFLLYYTRYFCHVIEGSEEALHRHLQSLYNDETISTHLGRLKLLVTYHHINQRFLSSWTQITAKPPRLLEKIDPNSDLQVTTGRVINCVQKLYNLGLALRDQEPREVRMSALVKQSVQEEEEPVAGRSRIISRRSLALVMPTVSDYDTTGHKMDTLPEYNLLEFLLSSQYIPDLSTYAESYGTIPSLHGYLERAWPVSSDYVPRNIFDDDNEEEADVTMENLSMISGNN